MTKITTKQRFARAAGIGAAGFLVSLAIITNDHMFRGDWGFLRCATAGAFLAGLVMARGFGGEGNWGWFRAGMAFAAATLLGAVIAVLLLPVDEALFQTNALGDVHRWLGSAMLGPVYVLGMVVENSAVAGAWALTFAGIQMYSQSLTARD